jgi:hypothetical protein
MSSLAETPEYKALRRFVSLTVEKRELKARLDALTAALQAMQPPLLAYLAAAGLKSLSLDGHLVLSQRDPYVRPLTGFTRQQVCEALKIAGLARMVREDFSTQSLTGHIRQLEERALLIEGCEPQPDGEVSIESLRRAGLHASLADVLQIRTAYSLHIRKKEDLYARTQRTRYDRPGTQNNSQEGYEENDEPDEPGADFNR